MRGKAADVLAGNVYKKHWFCGYMAPSTPIAGHLYPAMSSNVATAHKLLLICNYSFRCRNGFSCQDYKKIPHASKYYNMSIGRRSGKRMFSEYCIQKTSRRALASGQGNSRALTRLCALFLATGCPSAGWHAVILGLWPFGRLSVSASSTGRTSARRERRLRSRRCKRPGR